MIGVSLLMTAGARPRRPRFYGMRIVTIRADAVLCDALRPQRLMTPVAVRA